MDQRHCNEFIHPGQPILQVECKYGFKCTDFDKKHRLYFIHPIDEDTYFDVYNLNAKINFEKNANKMLAEVDGYLKSNNVNIKADLNKYLSRFNPMHRCTIDTFKKIIKHGIIISAKMQVEFEKNPLSSIWKEVSHDKEFTKFVQDHNITVSEKDVKKVNLIILIFKISFINIFFF